MRNGSCHQYGSIPGERLCGTVCREGRTIIQKVTRFCLNLSDGQIVTMRTSRAHIAGVGVSVSESVNDLKVSSEDFSRSVVTAATKALLDAGVTYTDVDQCVVCFDENARIPPAYLDVFGATGAAIARVENRAGLSTTIQYVRSGQNHCALMIGTNGNVRILQLSPRVLTDRLQRHLLLA